jgi:hypothetical protein
MRHLFDYRSELAQSLLGVEAGDPAVCRIDPDRLLRDFIELQLMRLTNSLASKGVCNSPAYALNEEAPQSPVPS